MNTDFRVAVDFFTHHKARKLKKRLGAAAVLSLLQLWAYAAKLRTDGTLSGMSVEDIELAAEWDGAEGAFSSALLDVGFLDQGEDGYSLHDWAENNPWVAEEKARSEQAYTDNVKAFSEEVSSIVGKLAEESFHCDMYMDCTSGAIQSPIESLFYIALNFVNKTSFLCRFSTLQHYTIGHHERLLIFPQHSVGKYKADFVVFYGIVSNEEEKNVSYDGKWVAVELDGHQFHEMSEPQRRYEKERDRFFQKEGYLVFRYTGSEIFKNPIKSAAEVMAYLVDTDEDDMLSTIPGKEDWGQGV